MASQSRRLRWADFTNDQKLGVIADELDDLEEEGDKRDARITQLKVIAGTLLVAVCTAIISAFATGLLK